jgi:hypothetical protein
MKFMFTAFNISSTAIRIAIAFRRVRTPNIPIPNRTAPRVR